VDAFTFHDMTGSRTGKRAGRSPYRAAAMSACALVVACVHVDHFSGKATEFNMQVAEVQDRTMLLNVVRAAYRFPMHFTELSTLSGTATASVGGTLTLPFATLNGGNGAFSAAPTGTLTNSPTFNMAVLETQEFYKGMLAPISEAQLSNYVEEGLQPELVFALAFGQILYQPAIAARTVSIENNFHGLKSAAAAACVEGFRPLARDETEREKEKAAAVKGKGEYSCFKQVLRALVFDQRLTLEPTKELTNLGPPLPQAAFDNPKWLDGLDLKTVKIGTVDAAACVKKKDSCPEGMEGLSQGTRAALTNGEQLFRIQKESADYRFCFDMEFQKDPRPEEVIKRGPEADDSDLPTKIKRAHIPEKLLCHNRLPENYEPSKDEKDNKSKAPANRLGWGLQDPVRGNETFLVQVQPRSTEGIVYFLGEIARCDLRLDKLSVCDVPKVYVPYRPEGQSREDILFAVSSTKVAQPSAKESGEAAPEKDPPPQFIDVDWSGQRYTVLVDPTAVDRSGQVLRVVTQLLALNRSAKDFPAPAVVPIISR
jgi:hypothetical protein